MMKKILFVNNNMEVGGVQKSLYNLLWEIKDDYDITLLLFSAHGEYVDKLPENVKIIEEKSLFRYLGKSQRKYKGTDALKRGFFALVSKIFGRPAAMKIITAAAKKLPEEYDCAFAFLHNGGKKSFYGGVQEYVINCVNAKRKVAYLHCDYENCGANFKGNNKLIAKFDGIAACSEGCRNAFCRALPELSEKCFVVKNCHRFDEIKALSEKDPLTYDENKVNAVAVARLSHEKGIDRAIEAAVIARSKGLPAMLHIVGGGKEREKLEKLVLGLGAEDYIRFYGEQGNPFRYMKNADFLFMTSYHEAAPMVIEEAVSIGVPVLSTATTSTDEMVLKTGAGWVCENDQDAVNEAFIKIASGKDAVYEIKKHLNELVPDNKIAAEQFRNITEG